MNEYVCFQLRKGCSPQNTFTLMLFNVPLAMLKETKHQGQTILHLLEMMLHQNGDINKVKETSKV